MTWSRVAIYYALFALALLYYLGSESSQGPRIEVPSKEVALVDIPPGLLTEVHIIREGRRVRCSREGGLWRVTEPRNQRVPTDLISSLVTTLLEIGPAEVVAEEATDVESFGLGPEALRLELYQRGHDAPVTVILGNRNPTHTAVYAQIEDSPQVLLVGRILEYYVDRIFEEVRRPTQSGAGPAIDMDRMEHTG